VLHELCTAGIRFVVIGSFGLKYVLPEALDLGYDPRDVDILLPPQLEEVARMIRLMIQLGFKCQSWDVVLHDDVDPSFLAQRIYIRCLRGSIVVDATYEFPGFTFEEAWSARSIFTSPCGTDVPIASLHHIAWLMKLRGLPKDMRRVERVISLTGDTSLWDIKTIGSNSVSHPT